jgi:hypothetical protein
MVTSLQTKETKKMTTNNTNTHNDSSSEKILSMILEELDDAFLIDPEWDQQNDWDKYLSQLSRIE